MSKPPHIEDVYFGDKLMIYRDDTRTELIGWVSNAFGEWWPFSNSDEIKTREGSFKTSEEAIDALLSMVNEGGDDGEKLGKNSQNPDRG